MNERDSNKRKYDEMSAHEQEVLEAYETGKLKRQRREAVAQRAAPFRTSMPGSRTSGSGASRSTSARAATEGAR